MLVDAKEIIGVLHDIVKMRFEAGEVDESNIDPRVGGVPGLDLDMLEVPRARVWVDPLFDIPGEVLRNVRMAPEWSWVGLHGKMEAQ